MLRPECCTHFENAFGVHSIDRYASRNHVQVRSRRYSGSPPSTMSRRRKGSTRSPANGHSRRTTLWKIFGFTHIMHYSAASFAVFCQATRWQRSSPRNGRLFLVGALCFAPDHIKTSRVRIVRGILTHPNDLPLQAHLLPRGQLLALRITRT